MTVLSSCGPEFIFCLRWPPLCAIEPHAARCTLRHDAAQSSTLSPSRWEELGGAPERCLYLAWRPPPDALVSFFVLELSGAEGSRAHTTSAYTEIFT